MTISTFAISLVAFSSASCGVKEASFNNATATKCCCQEDSKEQETEVDSEAGQENVSTTKRESKSEVDLSQTNKMCPVMPNELAEDAWTTIYKGKVIRFCCNNCVDSFRRKPERYLHRVPQLKQEDGTQAESDKTSLLDKQWFLWTSRIGIALIALLVCWPWKFLQKKSSQPLSKIRKVFVTAMRFGVLALIPMTMWCMKLDKLNANLKLDLVKTRASNSIHHATYFDFGVPPIPHRPKIDVALERTFYRGNDERSNVLYNNGNYQTAVFHIVLQHADGTSVKVGDSLTNKPLYLQYTINRAPNVPKRMFDKKIMEDIYLTRRYDPLMGWDSPIQDKKPVLSHEEGQSWRCRFPLPITAGNDGAAGSIHFDPATVSKEELTKISGIDAKVAHWFVAYRDAGYPIDGPDDLRQAGIEGEPARILAGSLSNAKHEGVVYVCEAFYYEGRQMGARIHYGLKFDVKVLDGIIQEGSEIWMGSLSRSQKAAKGAIPDDQWLGSEALPFLPEPQNISDKLLGIDDYDF